MYMYSWFTLLYSRNWHNDVKQLYSNKDVKKNILSTFMVKSSPWKLCRLPATQSPILIFAVTTRDNGRENFPVIKISPKQWAIILPLSAASDSNRKHSTPSKRNFTPNHFQNIEKEEISATYYMRSA